MDSCMICFEPAIAASPTDAATDADSLTATATTVAIAAADGTTTTPPTTTDASLVRELCGQACPAIVCVSCLVAHVRASLDECYAGVLPRVRCPICLTRLNKVQWMSRLPAPSSPRAAIPANVDSAYETCTARLVERYETFCHKACSLQSPCCHKIDYSHLPGATVLSDSDAAIDALQTKVVDNNNNNNSNNNNNNSNNNNNNSNSNNSNNSNSTDADLPTTASATISSTTGSNAVNDNDDNSNTDDKDTLEPQPALEPTAVEFLARCRAFCFHRGDDGRALVQFALAQFESHAAAETAVYDALARILDDERRATLLLSLLYACPSAYTRCCNRAFCFNCKRGSHHAVCERESDVIDDATCVARCRSCRVMIVKVEGCDSVTCVCGFSMSWNREVAIRRRDVRGLIAVDIFDRDVFERWEQWRAKAVHWAAQIAQRLHERHRRAWLAKHAPLMRRCFAGFLWRLRAKSRHTALQRELFWRVYDLTHPEELCETNDFVASLFAMNVSVAA